MLKLGICITGSFCSMDDMLYVLDELKDDYDIEVFLTPHVNIMNTRFYSHEDLKTEIQKRVGQKIHTTIQEAEVYGPMKKLDAVLVYPCDASTLAKLNHGINDNAVTMLIKSSLRNATPIVLGVYSNDILSFSGQNLFTLMGRKHFYFVPMYQDHYKNKPNSMIACKNKVKKTLLCALENKQYQPFILGYKEV
ncbi:dipicolinate synthase subunit B [Candidatus Stoquefichus massiliensis]|uniref:dipicolinate synthase subunit B n=1 Tax=Candidatus Stoquefichus massiliensis TaxID=1470350 RepID=UPI00048353B1|nr:dipicolinate synthase subunit B [Candidatus Stoquefichus massiliensis]